MNSTSDPTRFNTLQTPNWCAGCGNYGLQSALKKALGQLGLMPHQVCLATGIGCSGKMAHWVQAYGLHGLHGRTLPLAAGIKLANHELTVIAEGGDGDGLSEGMGHFIHACRRNLDLTYIIHNNGVFSLTTGQASSTGRQGRETATTPHGAIEPPFSPTALAIAAGASFVARGFSGDVEHLKEIYVQAIEHPGFSFVDVMQVCVTYNSERSYRWYQERIHRLGSDDHDASDRNAAMALAMGGTDERLAIGVYYRDDRPSYHKELPQLAGPPLVDQPIGGTDLTALMDQLT
jgi:2-oxoglutarate ferredoxin oxidoreductase subunit beta